MSLEDKQKQVIGTAEINREKCVAFTSHRTCYVCQRACPLPKNAITLKSEGSAERPYLDANLCNGCGACEKDCPVVGAIKVIAPIEIP